MSVIANLFINDKMPSGLAVICGSLLTIPTTISPLGGLVYGAASTTSFSFIDSFLEKHLTPPHPLTSMATKIVAVALPLILAPIGGWIATVAFGFKFSLSNILFLGSANPICIKIVLSTFDFIVKGHRIAQAELDLGRRIARGEERVV